MNSNENENEFSVVKFGDMRSKEVIHILNGDRIGFVSDMEIDYRTGKVLSLTVPGPYKFMGILGREKDIIIKWENIKKIGDDLIIVDKVEK